MSRFNNWQMPTFDTHDETPWHWVCQHRDKFHLSQNTDIGAFTYINAKYGVTIAGNVQVGSHCAIYSHNTIDNTQGQIVIKAGATIGSHTVIFPGVTIGVGAKIGAHSLVKTDVPDHETWAGVPARKLK
jgi:acetyltransferase-like isoleucine patch superfamily enzyme